MSSSSSIKVWGKYMKELQHTLTEAKTNFANICQLINNSICCINDLNIQIRFGGGLGVR